MNNLKIASLLALLTVVSFARASQDGQHQLDPMTWQEHWTVLEVLRDNGHLDAGTRFSMVNLREPPKQTVLEWKQGQAFTRRAFALVQQKKKQTFEAVIDLNKRKLVPWQELEGMQPNWLAEEYESMADTVKQHADFIAAMERRGITDLTFIDCFVGPPGYFGTDEQKDRRIGHFSCEQVGGDKGRPTTRQDMICIFERETGDMSWRHVADGRYVAPSIVAVNHDHYFNYRIDLDVDGSRNSFRIDRLETQILPEEHPRRSIWVSKPEIARKGSDAKLNIKLSHPAIWRVISSSRKNHVGYPTSYQLSPGKNTNTLMTDDDYPRRRAGFIDHHLWVTPYREDERYSAGNYPTLSTPGMGMHHMVRAEDWPVMPVLWLCGP